MFTIVSKFLVPRGYEGFAFFPFIIAGNKSRVKDEVFLSHEKIHIRQQQETLVILFFLWYFTEFFIRFIQFKNSKKAYRNISFEQEAYANEHNTDYLKDRRFWGFLKYL
jgi:hypothetical protein